MRNKYGWDLSKFSVLNIPDRRKYEYGFSLFNFKGGSMNIGFGTYRLKSGKYKWMVLDHDTGKVLLRSNKGRTCDKNKQNIAPIQKAFKSIRLPCSWKINRR